MKSRLGPREEPSSVVLRDPLALPVVFQVSPVPKCPIHSLKVGPYQLPVSNRKVRGMECDI